MNLEYINEFYRYEDGVLYYKKRPSQNTRIGMKVGCANKKDGYERISIKNKRYLTHRIIFMMHHGYLPEFIDHINGDKSDNRIENLRAATKAQNEHNTGLRKNNTSGVKGVTWHAIGKKWMVQLLVNGEHKYFGLYFDLEVAKFVAETMRYKYHGKFARQL